MTRMFSSGMCRMAMTGLVTAAFVPIAWGQVLPRNKAPAGQATATPSTTATPTVVAPVPATRVVGEPAGQTRREGRQEARDDRADAKNVGETRPQARETARETRQDTRQNIQATRAADMGVWFNNRGNNGLVISDVANNGVFATAGFREGDQLVSLNGQPITTESQFVQYLTGTNVGTQPVQVIVMRNGQQQTLTLQPTALTQGVVNHDPFYQYGMMIDESNPNQMLVQRVYPRTPAYYAGLRQGDIITTLGGQRIANLNAFTQGLTQANGAIPLQITRSGQTRDIQLDPVGVSNSSVRTGVQSNLDSSVSGIAAVNAQGGATVTTPGLNAAAPNSIRAKAPAVQGGVNTTTQSTVTGTAAPLTPSTGTGAAAAGTIGTSGTTGANVTGSAGPTGTAAGVSGSAGVAPQAGATGTAGVGPSGANVTGSAGVGGTGASATGGVKAGATGGASPSGT